MKMLINVAVVMIIGAKLQVKTLKISQVHQENSMISLLYQWLALKIVNFKFNLAIDNYNMKVETILSELNIIIN
jgi:hypothetical protein